jgi:hypothetical protein
MEPEYEYDVFGMIIGVKQPNPEQEQEQPEPEEKPKKRGK